MPKRRLIDDIKLDPGRYYRSPSDVNRDRRFSDEERLQIFAAWEDEMRRATAVEGEESVRFRQLIEARAELETRRRKTVGQS